MSQICNGDKLYIVTRQDLAPGDILAQSCHAVAEFGREYPDVFLEWQDVSNYIAVLECKDEKELLSLIDRADKKRIRFSVFFEPDLDNEITAIALEPGLESKKLCSSLRLALKPKKPKSQSNGCLTVSST